MCGIVGYVGNKAAMPILMEGLSRLEYRDYDSARMALVRDGRVDVYRKKGRISELRGVLPKRNAANAGIAHTRWATHGQPSDANAHPHKDQSGKVAIVHNGIVENARELKAYLAANGVVFSSETDIEVLAALIADEYQGDLFEAVRKSLLRVAGTYGLGVVHEDHPDEMRGSGGEAPGDSGCGLLHGGQP